MIIGSKATLSVALAGRGDCYNHPRDGMIRYYAAVGLQIVGLLITLESLILYFGDMGPLLRLGTVGVGIFYAGRLIQPKGE